MTSKVKKVYAQIQTSEINSLSLAILSKTYLLGEDSSAYLETLINWLTVTQVQMKNAIKEKL